MCTAALATLQNIEAALNSFCYTSVASGIAAATADAAASAAGDACSSSTGDTLSHNNSLYCPLF